MKGFKNIMEFFRHYCVSGQRSHHGRNGIRTTPWAGGSPNKESALLKTAKPTVNRCPQCGHLNPVNVPDCANCEAILPPL